MLEGSEGKIFLIFCEKVEVFIRKNDFIIL